MTQEILVVDPLEIDPWKLPSVNLEDRPQLPQSRGIYFCLKQRRVLYIGKAEKDFNARWVKHHRFEQLEKIGGVTIAYWAVSLDVNLTVLEKQLIEVFNPEANKTPIERDLSSKQTVGKDERPRIASLGEWHEDLLKVSAIINDRSDAQQAASLLCAKLQEEEGKIRQQVCYLAAKRGISFEDMWLSLLQGGYRKLATEEVKRLDAIAPFTE